MSTIAANMVVAFHYKVATSEGEHVDASPAGEPLTILVGHGNIIPGLERQMLGRREGEAFEATVAPEDGYGVVEPELEFAVPKSNFPANVRDRLKPGMGFHGPHPTKDADVAYTILAIEGDDVRVSGNHQLAGKTLVFSIEIGAVRQASREELAHGHVHGPGGHHH